MLKRKIFIIILIALSFKTNAIKMNVIVDEDCSVFKGMITKVSESNIDLLLTNGTSTNISRTKIKSIFLYQTNKNPISLIKKSSLKDAREFILNDENATSFTAWHYNTLDDLIFLWNIDGKSIVVNESQIKEIKIPIKKLSPIASNITLSYQTQFISRCKDIKVSPINSKATAFPFKIIQDEIRIEEYLNNLEEAFLRLEKLEQRINFYPYPLLYSLRSKLGLVYYNKNIDTENLFPFYFKWAQGKKYHFQSRTYFGAVQSELSPTLQPKFLLKTDVKSHFIHASFEGNIAGIGAGSDVFQSIETSDELDSQNIWIPSFNHSFIVGADWKKYSFSFGNTYPTHALKLYSISRALFKYRNESPHKVLRLSYNAKTFKSTLNYSWGENNIGDEAFEQKFLRFTTQYFYSDQITLKYTQVVLNGLLNGQISNNLELKHLGSEMGIQHQFSHYVSLNLYIQYLKRTYEATDININIDESNTILGGSLELLF